MTSATYVLIHGAGDTGWYWNDRLFPPAWLHRVVRDRLGITPDEIDSGHCPALSRPRELAERLETYWVQRGT